MNSNDKNSHYSYETSSKQKQQQNHGSSSSRKVKIKGRRKFNNNIFLTTTGGSSCEQILFLFVLLMGLIVLFNTYHIFKIEDYGHSHSSHNIHQHQYHPLAAAAISNNNNNKEKKKEKVVVVVPQFPLQKSSKEEEEDEDDDELTSQSPTEDNEATKENDSTTKDTDKEDDDDDYDELTSQSPTEGDEATKENDSITKDDDSSTKEKNPDESSPPPQIKDDKDVENEIDEHLLRILRHVGINKASDLLDSKDNDKNNDNKDNISYYLPTWEEVIQHVGNDGPIILGLEKCQDYNTNIVPNKKDRHIGIAGPFSSGTHYLSDLLIKNCEFPIAADTVTDKQKLLTHRKDGILWQVPWGKHQSPKYRTKHNTKLNDKIRDAEAAVKKNKKNKDRNGNEKDKLQLQLQQKLQRAKDELELYNQSILPPSLLEYNTNVLPVVVVRDPWTWMQSMCKTRYAAHWYHIVPNHCPNFIATQLEKDWFHKTKEEVQDYYKNEKQKIWMVDNVLNKANYTIDKNIIPLYVKYNSENSTHDSLVHMWKDWYQDYYDVQYPRLMIRLEDLVFYPHETIRQVCECVEGAVYVGDENLQLNLNSAIGGSGVGVDNIHGTDRTGLLGAMAKHIKSNKTKGMTKEDYNFAIAALTESDVMNYFRYKIPSYH